MFSADLFFFLMQQGSSTVWHFSILVIFCKEQLLLLKIDFLFSVFIRACSESFKWSHCHGSIKMPLAAATIWGSAADCRRRVAAAGAKV